MIDSLKHVDAVFTATLSVNRLYGIVGLQNGLLQIGLLHNTDHPRGIIVWFWKNIFMGNPNFSHVFGVRKRQGKNER